MNPRCVYLHLDEALCRQLCKIMLWRLCQGYGIYPENNYYFITVFRKLKCSCVCLIFLLTAYAIVVIAVLYEHWLNTVFIGVTESNEAGARYTLSSFGSGASGYLIAGSS